MRKKKEDVIRIGDHIAIIDPKFVKRVGYAIHPSDFYDELKTDLEVLRALKIMGLRPEKERVGLFKVDNIVPDEIVRAIAFIKTRQLGFGGDERTIHYSDQIIKDVADGIFFVHGKKVVKTGKRFSGHGYYHSDGEYDYEPGGLDDCKTHVLINIITLNNLVLEDFWIEECNVRKIKW